MTIKTYKEIPIELLHDGRFTANLRGIKIIKPSVDAVKKAIDNADKIKFEPFAALVERSWRDRYEDCPDGLVRLNITSIGKRKSRRGYHEDMVFIDERGDERTEVLLDTPANLEAYRALIIHREETKRIVREREEEEDRLGESLAAKGKFDA